MKCGTCGADTKVIDSRDKGAMVWRRRECLRVLCRTRFTTMEIRVHEPNGHGGRTDTVTRLVYKVLEDVKASLAKRLGLG